MLANHHRRHYCAARPADTRARARASDNLHRAPASLVQPCHDEARFRNGPTNYLGITNRLLVAHTARGPERESCGKDKCERLHQHFPQRETISCNF